MLVRWVLLGLSEMREVSASKKSLSDRMRTHEMQ